MKFKDTIIKVTANVELRGSDLLLLRECALHHYDGLCKVYFHSGRGEEIYDTFCLQRGSPAAYLDETAEIELSFRDLNRFSKLLEVGVPSREQECRELTENIKSVMEEIKKKRLLLGP